MHLKKKKINSTAVIELEVLKKFLLFCAVIGYQIHILTVSLVITIGTFQIQGNRSWIFQQYNLPFLRQASQ